MNLVFGDRNGQGSCAFSGGVGSERFGSEAGEGDQERDSAGDIPVMSASEKAVVGRGILERRILCVDSGETRCRSDDSEICEGAGRRIQAASQGRAGGTLLNTPRLAAEIFIFGDFRTTIPVWVTMISRSGRIGFERSAGEVVQDMPSLPAPCLKALVSYGSAAKSQVPALREMEAALLKKGKKPTDPTVKSLQAAIRKIESATSAPELRDLPRA